jgi:hypothetical protein
MVAWSDVVYYSEDSPSGLKWKIDIYYSGLFGGSAIKCTKGANAGSVSDGRWNFKYQQQVYRASRVIWEITNGAIPPDMVVDHEDGNALNNNILNLRVVPQTVNNRNRAKSSNNKTGTCGVTTMVVKDKKYGTFEYYSANWYNGGIMKTKRFSIAKLGRDKAYELACLHRAAMISEMNINGAGYTSDHGRR